MRAFFLCLIAVASHAATTVYQASVDQLTVVHGAAVPDSDVHHNAPKSLRVEPGKHYPDALVRSAPVALTIGKRYELSGWVRTDISRSATPAGRRSPPAPRSPWRPCPSTFTPKPWPALAPGPASPRSPPPARRMRSFSPSPTAGRLRARHGSKASRSTKLPPAMPGPPARLSKPSDPLTGIRRPDGSIFTSKANPTSADTSMAISWRAKFPSISSGAPPISASPPPDGATFAPGRRALLRGFDREILEEMRGIADGASDAGVKWQGAASIWSISWWRTSRSNSANFAAP